MLVHIGQTARVIHVLVREHGLFACLESGWAILLKFWST